MAEAASCPILTASLRSEDLMSDIEPLPASGPNSAPTTPSQAFPSLYEDPASSQPRVHSQPATPFGSRSGSSEVTSQLYASLRRSREVEARARFHLELQSSTRRSILDPEQEPASLTQEGLGEAEPPHQRLETEEAPSCPSSALSSPSSQHRVQRGASSGSSVSQGQEPIDQSKAGPRQKHPVSPGNRQSGVSVNGGSMAGQNTHHSCSDLESLAEEMSQKLSAGVEATYKKGGSRHISDMESVRSHLQGILRASKDPSYRDSPMQLSGLGEKDEDHSFESDSTVSLLNARPLQEISPPLSVTGIDELFPRYASLRPRSGQDPSSYTEMQLLRDSLEKERTRRKHLERHIQNLQNRILELQQQLAIAVSADKKKDVMIEQLDKTLAKVVEGWNKHEAERSEAMRRLQEEREEAERARNQQQERLSKLEQCLSQTAEALGREQHEAIDRQKQIELMEKEKSILVRSLESEKQRGQILQSQQEGAAAVQLHEHRQLDTLRATVEELQEARAQSERQLEERCQGLQEEYERQLESERAQSQKEAQQASNAKQVLASVQSQAQQLERELDAARRERDSLQMDITLVKARHESQRMKLESELKVALEQQVTERLAEVHEESSRQMASIREQHRKQLMELSSHQEKELANQLSQFKKELQEREEKQRRLMEDYELRLAKGQEEARELLSAKRKLEAQRVEMVGRLQSMMQSHWNEALRVLMSESSPQGMKRRQVEKGLSDSSVALHDSKTSLTQKTMAVPPSKAEPLPPSEPIQSKLFEIELMKESLSKAVLELQAAEGLAKPSTQANIPSKEKPKAAGQSNQEGRSGVSQAPYHVAASNDNHSLQKSWASHTAFPQAVPLQPAVQRTSQRPLAKDHEPPLGSSGPGTRNVIGGNSSAFSSHQQNQHEDHGSFLYANQSQFYPLIASGHVTADLSQLLNHSFASQMSFSPLEPQVDETGLSTARHLYSSRPDLSQELPEHSPYSPGFIRQLKAVLGYPHDELAEHPLTDDTLYEPAGSEGSSFQNSTMEGPGRSFLQPGDPQRQSLQHCIRLLLDRTPGDPLNEKPESPPRSVGQPPFLQGAPLGYRDRSTGIWDNVRQPPAGQPAALRIPQAVQKSKVPEAVPQSRSREPYTPPRASSVSQAGTLSPKDVAEISRLLEIYQMQQGRPVPMTEELFSCLHAVEQRGLEGTQGYRGNPAAQKTLDPMLNEAVRREVAPVQGSVPRRSSSARASSEKPQTTAKPVKKSAPPPVTQGSVKSSKSSIWR